MKRLVISVFLSLSFIFLMSAVSWAADKSVAVKIVNPCSYPYDFQQMAAAALIANNVEVNESSKTIAEFTISTVVNRRNNDLYNFGLGIVKGLLGPLIPSEKSNLVVINLSVKNESGEEVFKTTQQAESQNFQWLGAFPKMAKFKQKTIQNCLTTLAVKYSSK